MVAPATMPSVNFFIVFSLIWFCHCPACMSLAQDGTGFEWREATDATATSSTIFTHITGIIATDRRKAENVPNRRIPPGAVVSVLYIGQRPALGSPCKQPPGQSGYRDYFDWTYSPAQFGGRLLNPLCSG